MIEGCVCLTANGSLSSSDMISIAALAFSVLSFVISQVISACRVKKEKTASNARYEEQRKQYEERLNEERKRREEDKREMEERNRISEEPYLVYKKSEIVSAETDKQITIRMNFLNKGRGSAYDIVPDLTCKAITINGAEVPMRRSDAVYDPIALAGETFVMTWEYDKPAVDFFRMTPTIKYKDASGRDYKQNFCIDIHGDGNGTSITYARPELCKE